MSSTKSPPQKHLEAALQQAVADYLRSLPERELQRFVRVCRRKGLNVRVDKRAGGV